MLTCQAKIVVMVTFILAKHQYVSIVSVSMLACDIKLLVYLKSHTYCVILL